MEPWEKGQLKRSIRKLQEDLDASQKSCRYFRRRCEILERIICDHDPSLVPPRGASQQERFFDAYTSNQWDDESELQAGPDTFFEFLHREISRNDSVEPRLRRWSATTVMFSFVVMSLGSKTYEYARKFFPLPSKQTIYAAFAEPIDEWKASLLNLDRLSSVCDLFRRRHQLEPGLSVDIGIGIDAMAMEPLLVSTNDASFSHTHVFAFMLLPLSPEYKPITLHLLTHKNGNASVNVLSVFETLKQDLQRLHFNVRFLATDGDSGYNHLHETMFSSWFSDFQRKGLEETWDKLKGPDVIVGDFLHLLKNARGRMINGSITMNLDGKFSFTASDMNNVLKLGSPLTDKTSTGKMKDTYPLEIFTLKHFMTLFMAGNYNMAFFILPYSLWASVVRHPCLSVQTRMDLLCIIMDICAFYEECLTNLDGVHVSDRKQADMPQFFCSRQHCRRMLNTVAIMVREMKQFPTNLALDRIGTHVLECQFGVIRLLCHYKHSWKMIIKSFTRSMLITDIASILGKPINANARINHGGVKLTENQIGEVYLSMPEVTVREVYEGVNVLMAEHSGPGVFGYETVMETAPKVAIFVQFIGNLVQACEASEMGTPKLWEGSKVSHSTIMARLVSFCNCSQIEGDSQESFTCEENSKEEEPPEFVRACENGGEFLDRETPTPCGNC